MRSSVRIVLDRVFESPSSFIKQTGPLYVDESLHPSVPERNPLLRTRSELQRYVDGLRPARRREFATRGLPKGASLGELFPTDQACTIAPTKTLINALLQWDWYPVTRSMVLEHFKVGLARKARLVEWVWTQARARTRSELSQQRTQLRHHGYMQGYYKPYYQRNKAHVQRQTAAWLAANRERKRAWMREYESAPDVALRKRLRAVARYKARRTALLAYQKQYDDANREARRQWWREHGTVQRRAKRLKKKLRQLG